jgi:hypothetical protein
LEAKEKKKKEKEENSKKIFLLGIQLLVPKVGSQK